MADDAIVRCRAELDRLVAARLAAARGEADLAALLRDVEAVVAGAVSRDGPPRVACGPGCAACCTVHVGTLAAEGAVAAAFLRRALAPADRAALAGRLRAFHASVRWLEDDERVRAPFRCPFLDARRACRIHAVRPLACRAVTSVDAGDCARALAGDGDGEGPPLVRMHLLQQALYREALDAVREGVRRRGLDPRCRDVSGMTALFLDDPALVDGWLAGAELPIA